MTILTDIEIDALSVLEEELTQGLRPFQAYLIRKVLNILAPDWKKTHPMYKFLDAETET